jgi:molybdopterin molybdotransferase
MIQFSEALTLLKNLAKECPLEKEFFPLEKSDGRICDKDIFSPEAVPSFDNSAMDGFAIRSKDTESASENNPIRIPVHSIIAAGDSIPCCSHSIRAMEIMTGAPVPQGLDAVIKIEDVEFLKEKNEILIRSFVPVGNNIRSKGEDYEIGQIVLPKGSLIRAESMMAMASLGIDQVSVYKKPVFAVLSTGKELAPYNTKNLPSGMIRNSTAIYLKTALGHLGAEVAHVKTMGDEIDTFKKYLTETLNQDIDILITTGAVSMGKYDFIAPTLKEMGGEIIFHKVAIRPGKPILVAKIPRIGRNPLVIFGMPGNPISSAVGFRFFLTPFLRELYGQTPEQALQIKLSQTTFKPEGLNCFYKAKLESLECGLVVSPLKQQASFMISPLVKSNAWVVFPENGKQINKDKEVSVYPLLPNQSYEWGNL